MFWASLYSMPPVSPKRLLSAVKLPAFLVTNPVNIRYLTGATVSIGALIVRPTSFTLFLDARYREKAASQIDAAIRIQPLEEFVPALSKIRRIGFEGDFVTCAAQSKLINKFKNTKFVRKDWILEEFRRKKTTSEQSAIRHACTITKRILKRVPRLLKIGSTENAIAFELEILARKLGADGMAFDSIVAFGSHTSRPHHSPTDRRLKKGDIVQIDMGVKVRGYCSDYSRVYFTGAITPEQQRAYRALKQAKKSAEKALKAGVDNHVLDRIARSELKRHGYDKEFSHSLGHGLGLEIHEGINLSGRAPLKRLLSGEAVTIEPGLYLAGKWGMRLEDTHIV